MSRRLFPALLAIARIGCDDREARSTARSDRHDGSWTAVAIDGQPVPQGFEVRISDGLVTGGRDGCNNWGYDENVAPAPDGSRMIVSDAMGCPETHERQSYRAALGQGSPDLTGGPDGSLRISANGHEIVAKPTPD